MINFGIQLLCKTLVAGLDVSLIQVNLINHELEAVQKESRP